MFLLEPQLSGVPKPQHHLQTQPDNKLGPHFYRSETTRLEQAFSRKVQAPRTAAASPCSPTRRAGKRAPGALGLCAGGCRARRATARAAGSEPGPRRPLHEEVTTAPSRQQQSLSLPTVIVRALHPSERPRDPARR